MPSGIQLGVGVKTASVYRITEQADLISTDNPLDIAIQGRGYFRVTLPSGDDAYSRSGAFQLSPTGEIVTPNGFTVAPSVTVPQDALSVTINESGEVLVSLEGQVASQNVGQLELTIFFNEAGLEAVGDNLFLETAASGPPNSGTPGSTCFGTLIQGFLETSNVNAVSEITSLITAQRAYELNSRVIAASDEMLSTVSTLR